MKTFVVMWCNEGLEYVGDVTMDKYNSVLSKLKGEKFLPRHNLMHMKLRAEYNPQRHYEIYFIGADDDIEAQFISEMFADNPQMAAETIRERGECFYSNRNDLSKVVIT